MKREVKHDCLLFTASNSVKLKMLARQSQLRYLIYVTESSSLKQILNLLKTCQYIEFSEVMKIENFHWKNYNFYILAQTLVCGSNEYMYP